MYENGILLCVKCGIFLTDANVKNLWQNVIKFYKGIEKYIGLHNNSLYFIIKYVGFFKYTSLYLNHMNTYWSLLNRNKYILHLI